jgi:hypothetical protein
LQRDTCAKHNPHLHMDSRRPRRRGHGHHGPSEPDQVTDVLSAITLLNAMMTQAQHKAAVRAFEGRVCNARLTAPAYAEAERALQASVQAAITTTTPKETDRFRAAMARLVPAVAMSIMVDWGMPVGDVARDAMVAALGEVAVVANLGTEDDMTAGGGGDHDDTTAPALGDVAPPHRPASTRT